jgi:murein DD-endopeptidase MepM/ murein hydrolase activator NlpD
MTRLRPALLPLLFTTAVFASLAGCARQDAPAPVDWRSGGPPPAYAPPPPNQMAAPSRAAASPPRHGAASTRAQPLPTAGVATPSQPQAPTQTHPDRVLVVDGDTIWSVSRRHGVPVRSIIDANNLKPPFRLVSGSIILLPQVRQHTVRPGETLYSISRLYSVDISTLARVNHLEPPYTVKLDTVMVIPPAVEGGQVAESHVPPPPAATNPPPGVATAADVPVPGSKPGRPPPAMAAAAPPPPGKVAAPPPAPAVPVGKGFMWPIDGGRVLANYGEESGGTRNDGVNIGAPLGTPVLASEAGVVAYTGNELRGYGNLVLIKHEGGWMTAYAHNQAILVKRGERVKRGQMIARVGATGGVAEPQLHFEMRKGTQPLDPATYLPGNGATAVND